MRFALSLLILVLIISAIPTWACRIVPIPPPVIIIRPDIEPIRLQNIDVVKHNVEVNIKDGVSETTLETVFYNPNHQQLEGTYLFPLPTNASVSKFSMWIDGKEMQAELLDATKARDLYISIVQRMIDPGLLEFVGRETFSLRIFPIPARGEKKIKLSYQEILPVNDNLMTYTYPLTTVGNGRQDTLGEFTMKVNISSQISLKSVFSPSHNIKVQKEDNKATVSYEATRIQPDKDFTLYISRSEQNIDISMIAYRKDSNDGYFLMMIAPKVGQDVTDQYSKDVVFVFDTSGSMITKNKIGQAKDALKYCLNNLKTGDRFNIITFATRVKKYNNQQNLIDVTKQSIQDAMTFVDEKIYASGGTNIDDALNQALKLAPKDTKRPFMIFFLTDGEPTIGVTDPTEIIANIKKENIGNLRLFSFGVGAQLNTKLLDKLSEQYRGDREYVAPDENIEIKVSSLFDKVSSPVLCDIQIDWPKTDKIKATEIYPKNIPDLFKGAQITLVGRYSGKGDQAIKVTGLVGERQQEFVYEITFPETDTNNNQIPRLWAVRKVGFLLEQIRLEGEQSGLKSEVVKLAEEFGIVTPYTSYLVVEDDIRITRPTSGVPRPMIQEREESAFQSNARRSFAPPAPAGAPMPEEARRKFDATKSAMSESVGERSVQASQDLKALSQAQTVDDQDEGKGQDNKSWMRKIDEKTFYLKNNVWQDSAYQAKTMTPIRIKYMSKEYFDLIQKKPGIGKFLALGKAVIIVFEGKAYEIYE